MDSAPASPRSTAAGPGETFLAEVAGERSVVRIYARPSHRGAAAHEVDAALLRLVKGLLPVPEVLEVRRADEATGMPALLVTSFLPGERLELLLPRLADAERATLGRSLGELLADLGGMPTLSTGPFVDGRLTIGSFEPDLDGLPAAVELAEPRLGWWSPDELTGLREVAVDAQALLDTVGRRVLVHSDFNAKNLLVDPDSLEVTGLLDWEFAHAGHPFTDLGNLLRFERDDGVHRRRARGVHRAPRRQRRRRPGPGPGRGPVGTGRPGGASGGEPGGRAGRPAAAEGGAEAGPGRLVRAPAGPAPVGLACAPRRTLVWRKESA